MSQNPGRTLSPARAAAGGLLLAALLTGSASADNRSLYQRAGAASRSGGVRLEHPIARDLQQVALTCFQDSLELVLNPGCFNPPTAGDCRTTSTQYFVQYITPDFATQYRLVSLAFITNDAATIFPSAGVVLIPTADNRFPTPAELASLQGTNVKGAQDTSVVEVDLRPANLFVSSGTDVVVCLQFPQGQQLTDVGVGPGIVVDDFPPDQNCDFFTADTGANWYRPVDTDPLDWGFQLIFEPVAVEGKSWSAVKALYGGQRVFPYKSP